MTLEETGTIMDVLRTAYPRFYAGKDAPDPAMSLKLWAEMFRDDDVALVAAAVKSLIQSDTNGFPPHIGAVKEKLRLLTSDGELAEIEAWGLVSTAVRNSLYGSREEFEKLPSVLRRLVGSPAQLREWAMMDSEMLHSVVSSNFMRSYKVVLSRERELAMLPPDVKALVGRIGTKDFDSISEKVEAPKLPTPEPSVPAPRELLKSAISLKTGRSREEVLAALRGMKP